MRRPKRSATTSRISGEAFTNTVGYLDSSRSSALATVGDATTFCLGDSHGEHEALAEFAAELHADWRSGA